MTDKELVLITFNKVMQTKSYTVVVMGTDEKRFAIYTDPSIGKTIQMHMTETEKPRPLTHDLINMIFKGLNVTVKQIVINDIHDTIYFARMSLEQKVGDVTHIVELDARPSDCITLALMHGVPVYCTREVLEKTIPIEE